MSKGKGKSRAAQAVPVVAVEVVAVPKVARTRLPLAQAQAHNVFVPLTADQTVVPAAIAFTEKGTNPKKVRVYGYDNADGGRGIPKDKRVVVVPGASCPKGVNGAQWDLLVSSLQADPAQTVAQLKANIAGRTIRRAYRAGAIRFAI